MALAGVFLAPRARATSLVDRIRKATNGLKEWHLVTKKPDGHGTMVKSSEEWGRGGIIKDYDLSEARQRVWAPVGWTEYRSGELHASRQSTYGGLTPYSGMRTLAGFVEMFSSAKNHPEFSVTRGLYVEGRLANRLVFRPGTEEARITLYADATSDIPFLGTVEARAAGAWKVVQRFEIDSGPVSAESVKLQLPAGVTVVNEEEAQRDWERKLDKPIATIRGDFMPVRIRGVWVGTNGLVVVLYTNGRSDQTLEGRAKGHTEVGPGGEQILSWAEPDRLGWEPLGWIRDDKSNRYLPVGGFQGTMYDGGGKFLHGLRWNGEDAQVEAYIPAVPGPTPRSLTLVFGGTALVVPPGFKPTGKWVTASEMIPKTTIDKTYKLRVTPDGAALPEWASLLGEAPHASAVPTLIAETRRDEALKTGNLKYAEAQARLYIEQVLAESATGDASYLFSDMYSKLGDVLAAEGKLSEARDAYQRACETADDKELAIIHGKLSRLDPHGKP